MLLFKNRTPQEMSGYGGETTNNRMELTAVVEALSALNRSYKVVLVTDSQYVKNGITTWITGWQKNNWQTADKKAVKNVDLWKQLLDQSARHKISWNWVRGHKADRWNNRADELAVAARKKTTQSEQKRAREPREDSENTIHLYTGVTCKHSTGEGAWCVIFCWRNHTKVIGQKVIGMTANQLYIKAISSALSGITKKYPVTVHSHSGYLVDGATSWLAGWKKRNWKTREGAEVSNKKQWQELASLLEAHTVRFILDDRENPLCHMLEAKEMAREYEQVVTP